MSTSRRALCAFALVAIIAAAEEQAPDRPISNPVYTDVAFTKTEVNVIYAHHQLPDKIDTTAGLLKLGGDANLIAVQIEYALNDRWSLVANKDGWVDFNPDTLLSEQEGFGDLGFGLKHVFYAGESTHAALRGTFEIPTGESDVFQGNGDGSFSPAVLATHIADNTVFNAVGGLVLPFDDDAESTTSYLSLGASHYLESGLSFLAEVNWFRVLAAGDGSSNFDSNQGGTTVPAVLTFEGGDYFNVGAASADENPDLVTAAVGVRYAISEGLNIGLGFEFPLTDEEESLIKNRTYVNAQIRF